MSNSVISSAGSAMHTTWLMNSSSAKKRKSGFAGALAEIASRVKNWITINQRDAEKRLGQRRRVLPIAHQVHEPAPQVEPLALAEQHRLLVELVHGPANRQQAASERHAAHRHDVRQRVGVVALAPASAAAAPRR